MRIGFYTSTLNDRPFEEVADFAAAAGFDAVEIDVGGHIGSPDKVAGAVAIARDRGLLVSSITLFGNQLEPDPAKRAALHARTADFAHAVDAAGVPIFVIFPGRDTTVAEDANYQRFAGQLNGLLASMPASSLQLAIENWPGPADDFIATTPAGWARLLALVPDPRFGIEFDPSHLIRLGIDPVRAYDQVRHRVKILHGKDTLVDAAKLQAVGYHGKGWWRYVLPGRAGLDWPEFLRQVRAGGFDGVIAIEHEDADFGWPGKDLEARLEGERQGLAFLRGALG